MSKTRLWQRAVDVFTVLAVAIGLFAYANHAAANAKASTTDLTALLWIVGCFASVAGAFFMLGLGGFAIWDAIAERRSR